MRFLRTLLCLLLASGTIVKVTHASERPGQDIRLVLQITVDGLRADLLNRYQAGFGKDGFDVESLH